MSSGDRSGLPKALEYYRALRAYREEEAYAYRARRLMEQEQSQDPIERDLRRIVESVMTCAEVVALLNAHGCVDLTHSLDLSSCTEHPIANGGLGDVFRGKLIDGSPVAIKTLRAYGDTGTPNGTYQKRAAREIYTWSKCKHPNVVSLTGLAVFRNSLAMISRWEGNGNLTSHLSRNKDADRCLLSQSICAGLAYLHENDIIHGDLKGANVLIAQDGTPMLMDFGNASLLGATLQFTQTKSGTNYSLQWTAPEILREKTGHTKAGDIYALGMTILEVFTGEIPYPNKKDHVVLTLVLNAKKTPKRPKEAIPETSVSGNILWAILQSCWSYNPERRPSAEAVWKMMTPITSEMLKEVKDEPEENVSMDED